jgi:hypothetical protein
MGIFLKFPDMKRKNLKLVCIPYKICICTYQTMVSQEFYPLRYNGLNGIVWNMEDLMTAVMRTSNPTTCMQITCNMEHVGRL